MRNRLCSALLAIFALLGPLQAASQAQYKLKHKFNIGGEGGWDTLTYDPAGERLFISHATRVEVVDARKGTVIAEIADTPGVHAIALAPELGKGFTSNGRDNSVTVFDLKTLKETSRIKLPEGDTNPDAILYDAASKRLFVFNGRSNNVTIIEAASGKVVSSVALHGKPEFAAADGKGMVYVNIEDKSEIQVIDAKKGTVTAAWPLTGCEEPSGLAMDVKHHRLFAGCNNRVMAIVNADSGKVITTVPIGEGVDGTVFDPGTGLAFTSNGRNGTLTVVHEDSPDRYTVVGNPETQKFARTLAIDLKSHEVFLVTADIEEQPPAAGQTRPRREIKKDTFTLLVMEKK